MRLFLKNETLQAFLPVLPTLESKVEELLESRNCSPAWIVQQGPVLKQILYLNFETRSHIAHAGLKLIT